MDMNSKQEFPFEWNKKQQKQAKIRKWNLPFSHLNIIIINIITFQIINMISIHVFYHKLLKSECLITLFINEASKLPLRRQNFPVVFLLNWSSSAVTLFAFYFFTFLTPILAPSWYRSVRKFWELLMAWKAWVDVCYLWRPSTAFSQGSCSVDYLFVNFYSLLFWWFWSSNNFQLFYLLFQLLSLSFNTCMPFGSWWYVALGTDWPDIF